MGRLGHTRIEDVPNHPDHTLSLRAKDGIFSAHLIGASLASTILLCLYEKQLEQDIYVIVGF